jgi:hypothetical protein
VLAKSRRRMGKSSRGTERLDGWAVEHDDDTCQAVWWDEPQNHRWTVYRFGPQNPCTVPAGIRGGTWCHHEACIEAKLSHEGRMAVGSADFELDHNTLQVWWFALNI